MIAKVRRSERTPIEKIIQAVEKTKGQQWRQFKNRHGDGGLALVLTLARQASGLTNTEPALNLEIQPSANISMMTKRYRQRMDKDPQERSCARRAAQMLNATI